mgnify:CR=1 FL=1
MIEKEVKFIVVTGGVVSGLGKGLFEKMGHSYFLGKTPMKVYPFVLVFQRG